MRKEESENRMNDESFNKSIIHSVIQINYNKKRAVQTSLQSNLQIKILIDDIPILDVGCIAQHCIHSTCSPG